MSRFRTTPTACIICVSIASLSNAIAEPVEGTFSGQILGTGGSTPIIDTISDGDTVSGTFRYNTDDVSTREANSSASSVGPNFPAFTEEGTNYTFSDPSANYLSLSVNDRTWTTGSGFSITTANDVEARAVTGTFDSVDLLNFDYGDATTPTPRGSSSAFGRVGLVDYSGADNSSLLNSFALPATANDINTSDAAGTISGAGVLISEGPSPSPDDDYLINFEVDPEDFSFSGTSPEPPQPPDPMSIPDSGRVSTGLTDGTNTFPVGFDWSLSESELSFDMDVALVGDTDAAAEKLSVFQKGIADVWNGHSIIREGEEIPVVFDVGFTIGENDSSDYDVAVVEGGGRSSALEWYTDVSGLWTNELSAVWAPDELLGRITAHEFGHLLGLYDEYAAAPVHEPGVDTSKLCSNVTISDGLFDIAGRIVSGGEEYCDSIMSDNSVVRERHLEAILNYADEGFTRDFDILMSPFDPNFRSPGQFATPEIPPTAPAPVPLPATAWLMLLAMLGIGSFKACHGRAKPVQRG